MFKKQQKGFTLIELLVAISIFVVAITSITSIYIAIIRSQQKSNIQRLTSQDARYAMETITREVRMATGTDIEPAIRVAGKNLIIVTKNWETKETTTKTFSWDNNAILLDGQAITSSAVKVTAFTLENSIPLNEYNPADPTLEKPPRQPVITIAITTEHTEESEETPAHRRSKTTLRTTISSRDYRYAQ